MMPKLMEKMKVLQKKVKEKLKRVKEKLKREPQLITVQQPQEEMTISFNLKEEISYLLDGLDLL